MITTEDVGVASSAPPPAPRRKRHTVARVSHVIGELLVTAGAVILLFVGYQLFWTGVETAKAQNSIKQELLAKWGDPDEGLGIAPTVAPGEIPSSDPVVPGPDPGVAPVSLGEGIGILRIPRFGRDYAWAVVEGVRLSDLARGPGHYPGTAMPGEIGNFAVAGHRATYGEPFAGVEELRLGDKVVVETASTWLTYSIYEIDYPVPIDSSWALEPDPQNLGAEPTRSLMTLTTCHPRWASTYRFLVFTELVETLPKGDGVVPAALA